MTWQVPKDMHANLRHRRNLFLAGRDNPKLAREIWLACKRDPLFYFQSFAWTYDPRLNGEKRVPFISYPFQDKVLKVLIDSIGKEDVVIEKSRDMGATWMCLYVIEWRWHFYNSESYLLMSRKEDLVDKVADPKALMWKIDFIHKHLPAWLMPKVERSKLHFYNVDTNSTIDGESTTGETGKGDRRTAIMLDEFASVENGHRVLEATVDVTNTRWFVSTHNGIGTAFYDCCQKAQEVMLA